MASTRNYRSFTCSESRFLGAILLLTALAGSCQVNPVAHSTADLLSGEPSHVSMWKVYSFGKGSARARRLKNAATAERTVTRQLR